MAPGGQARKIRVKNVPAGSGDAGHASLSGELLSAGIRLAILPLDLLPSGLRDQVKEAGRKVLRGVAGLNRDIAEGLEHAADKLE